MIRAGIVINFVVSSLILGFLPACEPSDVDQFGEQTFTEQELAALDLKISVSLGQVDKEPRLQFILSFVMPRDRLILKLPDVFLRKEKLYNRIEDLTVSDTGNLFPYQDDNSIKILTSKKGKRVNVTYLFKPNDPPINDLPHKESFSAPIIRNNYFQFVGLMAFIFPVALIKAQSFSVTLDWVVPSKFQVFNSFGAKQTTQKIVTDFDKLRDAFFMAGSDMRIYEVTVRERPVYITFQGTWDLISDEQFIDVVTRLLTTQRETWHDENFPYFLVNFLSAESNCSGIINFAGTAHPNSFRAFFPSGCEFIPDMKQLISHELMHMWIGKKIKVGTQRGHIDGKWLTEGFTDYYGRILAYRAGVLSEEQYFNSLNRQLIKYYVSHEHMIPLKGLVARMYKHGYSSRSLEDVPYQQGEIMAWRLNQRIKINSSYRYSLDDVIRDMLAEADNAGGTKNFSIDEISSIINHYVPNAFQEEFSKVQYGKLFIPPKLTDCRTRYAEYPLQDTISDAISSNPIIFYGPHLKSCDAWLK
jgi:predicted metalloprotease with PDZ domain